MLISWYAFKLVSRQDNIESVVRIHSNERYPWRFPGAVTERGTVSAGDYAAVQANFGNTAAAVTTPEPATMTLMCIGAVSLLHRKKRG